MSLKIDDKQRKYAKVSRDRQSSSLPPIPGSCGLLHLRSEESGLYREPMEADRWQDLFGTLRSELSRSDMSEIRSLARCIAEKIQSMDAVMTRYCGLTCPSCEDACCTGLKVFFNRADILCLAALDEEAPPGQTRSQPTEPCRYLASDGCRLSRTLRPYVCVWFLCEAQMELLQSESVAFQRKFLKTMQDIRACRLRVESLYEHYFTV